jgi:hypothetical protein
MSHARTKLPSLMNFKLYITLVLLSFFLCSQAQAQEPWQSRTWQKLLHYSDDFTISEIENDDFFISSEGKSNPESEFLASVSLLTSIENTNDARVCHYPARALYLKSLGYEVLNIRGLCADFTQWQGELNKQQVSIVYADGYLGNPASFYGHILFKLKSDNLSTDLLSNSLNFGAKVPDDENPVVYIFKGLVGGYNAKYSSNHYYRYNINYAEVEMRDLWHYTLNLNVQEKALLVAHAWELLFTQYTYYFTHRNCAYHIAKLLELVLDEDLISNSRPFILPISVFSALVKAKTSSGHSAVLSIEHTLSRQARFRQHFAKLDKPLQTAVLQIAEAEDISINIQKMRENFNIEQQIMMFDVLLDYANFSLELDKENQHFSDLKKQLQRARIALPAKKAQWLVQIKAPPHTGQDPSTFRVSAGTNNVAGDYFDFLFRPAYYDMLSPSGGVLPNSALSMAALTLRVENSRFKLSKFDLLNIETIDTNASNFPGDVGIAWKLRVGNERNYLGPAKPSNEFFIESGIGKGTDFNDLTVYGLAVAKLQTPDALDTRVIVAPTFGVLWSNDYIKGLCQLSYPVRLDGTAYKNRIESRCELRTFATNKSDIRLGISSHFSTELFLSASWYF